MPRVCLLFLAISSIPTLAASGQGCDYPRRIYDIEPFVSDSLVADIDADGDQDVVFCHEFFDGLVSVALNMGDGRLTPAEFYETGRIPIAIGCGDFDNDGNLDLATANIGGQDVSILFGSGDGVFLDPVTVSAGGPPNSITICDLNQDGFDDLALSTGANLAVLISRGDRTFENVVNFEAGDFPFDVCSGDLTSDGYPDVVVANVLSASITIFVNWTGAGFEDQFDIAVLAGPSNIVLGDFDNDSDIDIAIGSESSDRVDVLENNGNGQFVGTPASSIGANLTSLEIIDIDGDENIDLLIAFSDRINVLRGDGRLGFQALPQIDNDNDPYLSHGDLNGNGSEDLVVGINRFLVLSNNGKGCFDLDNLITPDIPTRDALAADFDNDGNVDLATVSYTADLIRIFRNLGDGEFELKASIPYSDFGPIVSGDFDGDNILDLVADNLLYRNDGNCNFDKGQDLAILDSPDFIRSADLDGDSVDDLVVANDFSTFIIALNDGQGNFSSTRLTIVSVRDIEFGDYDSDGDLDIAVANSQGIEILNNAGNGSFSPALSIPFNFGLSQIEAGDIDGDSDIDFIGFNFQGAYRFINDGQGNLKIIEFGENEFGSSSARYTLADVDGDGSLDLTSTGFSPNSALDIGFNDGNGNFDSVESYSAGGNTRMSLVADFNHDNHLDFFTWINLGNVSGKLVLSQCRSILGDVNQDGEVDLLDIQAFVDLLESGRFQSEADINQDGVVDLIDVDPFINLLLGN